MELCVDRLIRLLREKGARRIGLQFPEGLKRLAYDAAAALRREGFCPIVSGNACYGACDIDERLLTMVDLLVHFGHAPLCAIDRVIYEPVFVDYDPAVIGRAIPLLKGRKVRITTVIQHIHMIQQAVAFLTERGFEVSVICGGSRTPHAGQVLGCAFGAARAAGDEEILFIGGGLFHPVGIAIATGRRVVAIDPLSGEVQQVEREGLMRRRFAMIERAREAERIGIILSTKPGQRRMELAQRLVTLTEKAVMIAMDEVTPDGLLNLGMDCYVNTACPRLAYDDSIRFPVPVLSPQEFEILLGERSWERYEIDEFC